MPDPVNTTGLLGRVTIPDAYAVHTTLLFEPSVTIGDRKYGHVIDPRSGRPAEGTLCVTVLGPTATQASALAQALIVLGVDQGRALLPRFEGQSLAYEAAAATLAYARDTLGLGRIVAITTLDNDRSGRLLERLGMRYEGIVRLADEDLRLYAIE